MEHKVRREAAPCNGKMNDRVRATHEILTRRRRTGYRDADSTKEATMAKHGRIAWAALLVASVASGADTPKPVPTFGGGVAVVALPVFVTDKNGQPMTGLAAGDFEVSEDGRPVKIVGFQEVDTRQASGSVPTAVAGAVRRQFLLLFDLSFTRVAGLVRARQAALEFVDKRLGPDDLVGVATFSVEKGMQILVSFTRDRRQARAAIEALGLAATVRKADPLNLAYDLDASGPKPAPGGRMSAEDMIEQQIEADRATGVAYDAKVKRLLQGLGQLARALDAVQGRKQVIYLSSGFTNANLVGAQGEKAKTLNEAVVRGELWNVDSNEHFGTAGQMTEMSQAFRGFALADAVVDTVDVGGLSVGGDVTRTAPDGSATSGDGRESLSAIASGSSGRFYRNANDLTPVLQQILDGTRHFYALAFEPGPAKGPGQIHKLKVKVKDASALSYRTAYVETADAPAAVARFEAADAIAKGLAGGEVALRALAVPYRSGERSALAVVLEIDGPSLLAGGTPEQLPLEIYGYALDAAGQVEDALSQTMSLDVAKAGARLAQRGLLLQSAFAVGPGRHTLRFLVRDAASRRRGLVSVDAEVPDFAAAMTAPPVLMEELSRWLPLKTAARSGVTIENPFRADLEFFAPRVAARIANGAASRFFVLAYDPHPAAGPSQGQARARLVGDDGVEHALGAVLQKALADESGYRRYVVEVTPQAVAPGRYRLLLDIDDGATARETARDVTVE